MNSGICVFGLRNRKVVVGIGVILLFLGLLKLGDSRIDSLPEFQRVTVRVQTEALGLSAEEVEQLITVPLEQDLLAGVAWVETLRSRSVPGLSYIDVLFERGTDLYRARQVVQERLSQAAALPNVSKAPQMIQPTASTSRVAMLTLSSKTLRPVEVGVLTRWTMMPRLLAIPGVSNVAIWGQRERQIQVQIDPPKLEELGVSIDQVINTAGNALWSSPLTFLEASTPGSGGFIETAQQRIGVQHVLPIVGPAEMAKLPVDESEKPGVVLGDVAKIVEDHQPLIGDAVIGADATSFVVVVEKFPGSDTVDVTRRLESAVAELRPGLKGVDIVDDNFRPADYLASVRNNLRGTAWISLALLLVALLVFVAGWRAAVVSGASLVVVFSAVTILLRAMGQSIDSLVVVGLVLVAGAVIDDTLRNVHHFAKRSGSRSIDEWLPKARQSFGRGLWALVMSIAMLIPLFLVHGLSGDAFYPRVAMTAAITLVVGALTAAMFTPPLAMLVMGSADPSSNASRSPITGAIGSVFVRVARLLAKLPAAAVAVTVAAIALGAFLVPSTDKALLPRLVDPHLVADVQGSAGTSLPEMKRITERILTEVRAVPGVSKSIGYVGQASSGDLAVGTETAQLWISLRSSADFDRTMSRVRAVVSGYPGVDGTVRSYSAQSLRRALTGPKAEVVARLYGQDMAVLQKQATQLRSKIAKAKGVRSVDIASPLAEATVEIEVDLAKAKALGIVPGEVRRVAAVMLAGIQVGNLYENQKVFEVTVWSTPESRRSIDDVRALPVPLPDGGFTTIGDVAQVRTRSILPVISHEDVTRYVDLAVHVSGRSVGAVESDVNRALRSISYPLEYHAEVLDDFRQETSALRRLWLFGFAASVAIFLLLQSLFNSWRMAAIVSISMPAALLGGVIAAKLDGGPFTLATAAGMVGVAFLSIRHAIDLGQSYQRERDDGTEYGEALSLGVLDDIAQPAIGSTLVTLALMVPLALGGATAGLEFASKTAVVILGGALTSLAWALWILPALHLGFGPKRDAKGQELDDEWFQASQEDEFANRITVRTKQRLRGLRTNRTTTSTTETGR